jgi:hypothetical protein
MAHPFASGATTLTIHMLVRLTATTDLIGSLAEYSWVLALGTDGAGGTPDTTVAGGTVAGAGTAITDTAVGTDIAVGTEVIVVVTPADTGADLLPVQAADSTGAMVVGFMAAEVSTVVAGALTEEAASMAAAIDKSSACN